MVIKVDMRLRGILVHSSSVSFCETASSEPWGKNRTHYCHGIREEGGGSQAEQGASVGLVKLPSNHAVPRCREREMMRDCKQGWRWSPRLEYCDLPSGGTAQVTCNAQVVNETLMEWPWNYFNCMYKDTMGHYWRQWSIKWFWWWFLHECIGRYIVIVNCISEEMSG